MDLFDKEKTEAIDILRAEGKAVENYSFGVTQLPPDPEAAAMFTMRYEIVITNQSNGKSMEMIGGIGLDWVGVFGEAIRQGQLD